MQRFGEKLRYLRRQQGLTLRGLAEDIDLSFSHLGNVESGKRKPSADLIFKIAKFFKVSTDSLMDDELELD